MNIIGLRTPLIHPGDDLVQILSSSLSHSNLTLEDGDVLVVASKAVSTIENRIVKINDVNPSVQARDLALKYDLEPEFVQLVINEADEIFGGVYKALLTIKEGILIANAGIDLSNTPMGTAVLWPENPQKTAESLRGRLEQLTGKNIGVVISDSRTVPLRMGTIAVSIASSGFHPIKNYVSRRDLFGKFLKVTRQSIADELACAAHLVMGEADEMMPLALVKKSKLHFQGTASPESAKIPKEECLYMKVLMDLKS